MTDDIIRPFIPKSLRREIFMLFHKNSHPGPSSTDRLIRRKYMWPGMSRDIAAWYIVTLSESEDYTHALTMIDRYVARSRTDQKLASFHDSESFH
ncbi:hypothetical protein TKK_0009434 [Trichogramma kaykai]